MNSSHARGLLRSSCVRVGPCPISSAIAAMPSVTNRSAMAPATRGQSARSAGPEPEPAPAATIAEVRSGWRRPNCSTA